ncbi:MAG: hypothetical protein Q4D26_08455 [Clostridia bacterium]|nr:hypothetical protein [Clostridia bacterium]
MKNKRCLGFLVVTLMLVISMFSNVFASSYGYWYNAAYPNNKVDFVSDIYIKATYGSNAFCNLTSSFDVSEGDVVSLSFYTQLIGIETDIDGAASGCQARIIAENGTVLATVRYTLRGSSDSSYLGGDKSVRITNTTAGKLTLDVSIEEPGASGTEVRLKKLNVKVNGTEV